MWTSHKPTLKPYLTAANQPPLGLRNLAEAMNAMENDRITISYDPSTGKLEFSAPKDQLEQASDTAQVLIKTAHACLLPKDRTNKAPSSSGDAPRSTSDVSGKDPKQSPAPRPQRKSGESSGRTGRIGSFEKVTFSLGEDQERAIHEFYTARRPPEQRHQVAVAMYIGEKVIGRQSFDYNEIYTLLHIGGERELPRALDVVVAQLQKENWVTKEDRSFGLKFLARDYVEKLSSEAA